MKNEHPRGSVPLHWRCRADANERLEEKHARHVAHARALLDDDDQATQGDGHSTTEKGNDTRGRHHD